MGAATFPRVTADGRTVWACCESMIGPACEHVRAAAPLPVDVARPAIVRPVVGETYYAPVLRIGAGGAAPIVPGEYHGVIVDGVSQAVAVVYSTRERAEAALADPAVWHPANVARVYVAAVVAVSSRRFAWADGGAS